MSICRYSENSRDKLTIGYGDFPPEGETFAALKGGRDDIIKLLESVLENHIDQNIPELGITITKPFYNEQRFKEPDDIPMETLICPCGNSGHIMIKLD